MSGAGGAGRRRACGLPANAQGWLSSAFRVQPLPRLVFDPDSGGPHPLSASPVSSEAGNQPEWGLDPRSPGRSLPEPRLRWAAPPTHPRVRLFYLFELMKRVFLSPDGSGVPGPTLKLPLSLGAGDRRRGEVRKGPVRRMAGRLATREEPPANPPASSHPGNPACPPAPAGPLFAHSTSDVSC